MPSNSKRRTTIITDPIHQVMNLGSDPELKECFNKIVNTRTFQRLRRISQLGLASYVFPGATHTRFSHSLGAAYLAHSVLTHLREWASTKKDWKQIDLRFNEVVMAALLHDVGHGPFSHLFEKVLEGYQWAPKHEDWTRKILSYQESEICQQLKKNKIDTARVSSIFTKPPGPELEQPYKQIVSSQLDVDRMDYLVRDSHFAGVAIGRFDVHYLIHSLVIVKHDKKGTRTLGITPKGVKAYEAFLLARQLMNRTVYYHHKVKVFEFMMEQFLRLVIKDINKLKASSIAPFIPPYLDRVAKAAQQKLDKNTFMTKSYKDYIRLTEDAIWNLVSAAADTKTAFAGRDLARKLLAREILPYHAIETGKSELLQAALIKENLKKDRDFHLLALKTTMYKGNGDEQVFVVDWEGDIKEVRKLSDTISMFQDRPEVESLLVVIDTTKKTGIETLAREGQFITPRIA